MLGFAQAWDAVVTALQAASAETGVPASQVLPGELGRSMPLRAPFLYVYLLPVSADERAPDGVPFAPAAELRVFCGVEPQQTTQAAVTEAVALGARTVDVLRGAGLQIVFDRSPVRLDSYTTKLAAAEVVATMRYSLDASRA